MIVESTEADPSSKEQPVECQQPLFRKRPLLLGNPIILSPNPVIGVRISVARSQARRLLCQIALKRLLYSGASVARFLGVSTSLVNRMANMETAPDLENWV
jgi:hypothetical protein